MKKGVRHTTNEIMAFIQKAEEVGITAACKEYDIHYTTGHRWISCYKLPVSQESAGENPDIISVLEEPTDVKLPVQLSEPSDALDGAETENVEQEESELLREFGTLILENERLKMRIRQLTRALTAMVAEE